MQPLSFSDNAQYYVLRPVLNTLLTAAEITAFGYRLLKMTMEGQFSDIPLTLCLSTVSWMQDPDSLWASAAKVSIAASQVFQRRRKYTHEFQNVLPRLPVPNLWQTTQRWQTDLSARVTSEDVLTDKRLKVEHFYYTNGWKLQFMLRMKALFQENWLEDIWKMGAYLTDRTALPLSTNCFGVDSIDGSPNEYADPRVDRIARILWLAMQEQRTLLAGERPLSEMERGAAIPIDHAFADAVVGNTRIPRHSDDSDFGDVEEIHQNSTHMVLLVNGHTFIIDGAHNNGKLLNEGELRVEIARVLQAAGKLEEGPHVTALSGQDRDQWALDRDLLMQNNKEQLRQLETAAVVVAFEEDEEPNTQQQAEITAKRARNRYWDKSLQLIVTGTGEVLSNVTHHGYDASVPFFLWDILLRKEEYADGVADAVAEQAVEAWDAVGRDAEPIEWDLSDELDTKAAAAVDELQGKLDRLDLHHLRLPFPREELKSGEIGMSPDSFMQMVLQLTYKQVYANDDELREGLTYESASHRAFYRGRTETIRSRSPATARLLQEFDQPANSDADKRRVLRAAVEEHAKQKMRCSTGGGIDRHILGLYVMSIAARRFSFGNWFLGEETHEMLGDEEFDPNQVSKRFHNATSQPYTDFLGGGFLPVTKRGNGFCYYIRKGDEARGREQVVDCYISTWRDKSPVTSEELAEAFRYNLKRCCDLFEIGGVISEASTDGMSGAGIEP